MLRTVAALVVGSGSQAASNAFAAFLATVFLPPDERGAMVIALAIASLASIVCGLGTGFSFRLLLPRHNNPNRLLRSYSALTLAVCSIAAIVSIAALSFFNVNSLALTAGCGLYSAVLLFNLQLTEARFAFGELKLGAYWATANAVGGLAGTVAGLATNQHGSELLLWQASGCGLITLGNLVSMVRRRTVLFGTARHAEIRSLVRTGFSPLIWGLGIVVISKADRLVLGQHEPEGVVAAYALAVTVSEMIRLFPTAFSQLITRYLAAGKSMSQLSTMVAGSVVSAVILGIVAIPVTDWAVRSLLDPVYSLTVDLLKILVVGELFMALYVPCARALQGLGLSALTARLGVAAMVIVLPLYFWLSPAHGAHGVAVTLAGGYACLGSASAALLLIQSRKLRSDVDLRTG